MISKETLDFLKKLDKNNNRDWFQANKKEFEKAKEDLTGFTAFLIGEGSKFDPLISQVMPEDCVFRIYRDVRFSKDKSPYKVHLGAYVSPGGRKSMAPGYYFHLQPGRSFIAGGKHIPDSAELLKIRNAVAKQTDEFLKILANKNYQNHFGEMRGDKLMKAPKGFPADHKAVEYLKLKDFMASLELFDDKFITSREFPAALVEYLKEMYPLVKFLRKALS
ncbi:MAG: DUF2461 domain-containing protein [Saprospiraceae bacterium]|nr:DUF2461 domain-containing protein [Pyrinomonadaceae bacterium]